MEIIYEDLWELSEGGVIAITTNGTVKKNGEAVMGAGCAKKCAERFPWFPGALGHWIKYSGNYVCPHISPWIVTFPVKHEWRDKASMALIKESCLELNALMTTVYDNDVVYLPKPGCGNGGLSWEKEVGPLLDNILHPRIKIVDYKR